MDAFHLLGALVLLHSGIQEAGCEAACGSPARFPIPYIVGGEDALDGEWPWQVSFQMHGTHFCGGSLITDQWVVSAAHCFYEDTPLQLYQVILGAHQLSNSAQNPNLVSQEVQRVVIHPLYTGAEDFSGDIALVELKSRVNFTDYILPICLPGPGLQLHPGLDCWVTGWGDVQAGVPLPPPETLQKVKVNLIDQKTCDDMYHINSTESPNTAIIQDDMICAGYPEGKKDSCQGDSGGPLVCKMGDPWILVGVVSWGPTECAAANRPGVYALIPAYRDWISSYVEGAASRRSATGPIISLALTALLLNTFLLGGS